MLLALHKPVSPLLDGRWALDDAASPVLGTARPPYTACPPPCYATRRTTASRIGGRAVPRRGARRIG